MGCQEGPVDVLGEAFGSSTVASHDPYFLVQVVEQVNSPGIRTLPDFGNTLDGHDENYAYSAIDAMFAYAYAFCHVKDSNLSYLVWRILRNSGILTGLWSAPDSEVQVEGSKEFVVAPTWKTRCFRSFRGTKCAGHCYGAPSN
ncbi:MAG: hypothetical protein QOE55_2502 [Acidobacteriaceae bacterium]|nr:hypothetical protein [Acidobacteriaceae bacterium]MEA3006015.1 hypothetical protein [Acidobacteriaceae bacterium]